MFDSSIISINQQTKIHIEGVHLILTNLASLALCAPPHEVDYSRTPKNIIFNKEEFVVFLDQAYGKESKNKPPEILWPALRDYMNSNNKRNLPGKFVTP